MELYCGNKWKIYNGNMLDMREVIEDSSIDSIVTDPPYELNFMGKGWDNSGIAFQADTWKRCFDALKSGGYLLAFGGSRTFHRIAVAIEDAGFEIRDVIMWLYGSGFPKSMDIGKAIEGKLTLGSANVKDIKKLDGEKHLVSGGWVSNELENGKRTKEYTQVKTDVIFHTELGKRYKGWGTALKPSYEPIIIARKPCEGSCTDNVIKYGVGGINIDECRVGIEELSYLSGKASNGNCFGTYNTESNKEVVINGRFPANTILTYDDTDFDEVCGGMPDTKSVASKSNFEKSDSGQVYGFANGGNIKSGVHFDDSGSAARYFYCAKASKRDRDEGLDSFETKQCVGGGGGIGNYLKDVNSASGKFGSEKAPHKNTHPTVKPTSLMQYLVRLVTPKGGTVLDPFNGSGSTGKAVMYENKERNADYKYIGIELTKEYIPISIARIEFASKECDESEEKETKETQMTIFDFIGSENE